MEYIYKITTTGSNNSLRLNSSQIAYLRQAPFTANLVAGVEVNTGIFSFNVPNTNYYQLWTGNSINNLQLNTQFCSSTSGRLLFGDDVNIQVFNSLPSDHTNEILTISSGLTSISSVLLSESAGTISLSSSVGIINSGYNNINFVNKYTLTSSFVSSTSYLYNLIVPVDSLTSGIILQTSSGNITGYTNISNALTDATTGDTIKLYKSISANIVLPDQVTLYIAPGVSIEAQDPTSPILRNGGKNFKVTGQGIIKNSFDGIDYTGMNYLITTGDTVFCVSNAATIFKSINNGTTWQTNGLTAGTFVSLYYNSGTGYAGGYNNSISAKLYRTVNSGATWTEVPNISNRNIIKNINFFDSTTGIYYVGGNFFSTTGAICRTVDGGQTWTPLPVTGLTSSTTYNSFNSSFPDSKTGFLVGGFSTAQAIFYKTVDSGATWQTISLTSNSYPTDIKFINSKTGFLINAERKNIPFINSMWPTVYKTVDSGDNWFPLTSITSNNTVSSYAPSIDFIDSLTGYIWFGGYVWKTIDGGINWSRISAPGTYDFSSQTQVRIRFSNSVTGYINGCDFNVVLKTVDGGYTWNRIFGNQFNSPAQAILLNNNVKAEIECDKIISYGNNNVSQFLGGTLEGNPIDSINLKANLIHSYYNAALYFISNNSTSALNINVKKISTGMPNRGDVGSSVIISHAGGYLNADEIEAYGTGHCLGHRRFELTAKVKRIKAGNNSPLFTTYPVYVSQGTGTQILNLYFDEILAYNGVFGPSLDTFAMAEGYAYLKGRSISSGGFTCINMEATNNRGYLVADVNKIMGFRAGVYANNPEYVEINNAVISASRTAGLNSAVALVQDKVLLKNCILYCSNTALGGYSIETQNGSGSTIKLINTWSKFNVQSGVSAAITNLNINPNLD